MTTGIGSEAQFMFETESTDGTFITPTKSVGMVTESFTETRERVMYPGVYGGRHYPVSVIDGNINVAGSVTVPLQAETIGKLLRMGIGGTFNTSGTGPYTHVLAGGDIDFGTTFQFGLPGTGGTVHPKNVLGTKCATMTLSQNPNEYGTLELACFGREIEYTSALATFAPDASPSPLTFAHMDVTPPGTGAAVCVDNVSVVINTGITQDFQVCTTLAGKAKVRPDAQRSVTGSFQMDFVDLTENNYYRAGTLGNLTAIWNSSASAYLELNMNVVYTGQSPVVNGFGRMVQQIDFEVVSATSDANAITVTLMNDEATP